MDPFTRRRLEKAIDELRSRTGQLPTLPDLAEAGFAEKIVDQAVREGFLVQVYVTLTNGTVMKGYKVAQA